MLRPGTTEHKQEMVLSIDTSPWSELPDRAAHAFISNSEKPPGNVLGGVVGLFLEVNLFCDLSESFSGFLNI